MAAYPPLVLVNGAMRQLAAGDSLAGFARTLPFYLASGAMSNIALLVTVNGAALPFSLASGAASNIALGL